MILLEQLPNPVPRVPYPDWLRKRVQEHNDIFKQKRITDMFKPIAKPVPVDIMDIEALNGEEEPSHPPVISTVVKRKRKEPPCVSVETPSSQKWQDVLGVPPPKGKTPDELLAWLEFHRKKWAFMRQHKQHRKKTRTENFTSGIHGGGAFFQQKRQILENDWQVIQVSDDHRLLSTYRNVVTGTAEIIAPGNLLSSPPI